MLAKSGCMLLWPIINTWINATRNLIPCTIWNSTLITKSGWIRFCVWEVPTSRWKSGSRWVHTGGHEGLQFVHFPWTWDLFWRSFHLLQIAAILPRNADECAGSSSHLQFGPEISDAWGPTIQESWPNDSCLKPAQATPTWLQFLYIILNTLILSLTAIWILF
jgi:hypothetical protein